MLQQPVINTPKAVLLSTRVCDMVCVHDQNMDNLLHFCSLTCAQRQCVLKFNYLCSILFVIKASYTHKQTLVCCQETEAQWKVTDRTLKWYTHTLTLHKVCNYRCTATVAQWIVGTYGIILYRKVNYYKCLHPWKLKLCWEWQGGSSWGKAAGWILMEQCAL